MFKAKGKVKNRAAVFKTVETVWWGVETTLDKEMKDFCAGAKPVKVDSLLVEWNGEEVYFTSPNGLMRRLKSLAGKMLGGFEKLIGRYSFLSMFMTSFILGYTTNKLFDWIVMLSPVLIRFTIKNYIWMFLLLLIFQIVVLFRLIMRELPAAMDNAYRHLNRADNLMSLRRTRRPK